jgi:nucleoside phosphorylase
MRSALIITALAVETKAVRSYLREGGPPQPDRWGTYYINGSFAGRNGEWRVAVVEVGQGNEAAAVKTALGFVHLMPELIILVGVAGGLKDVALGDVVVARSVHGYEKGKETEGGFLSRPEVFNSSVRLVEAAKYLAGTSAWRDRIVDRRGDPDVVVGPIVAGNKVVASESGFVRALLKERFSDALAVEMEGLGLLTAAHHVGVPAIVVRGVSDLLSNKERADSEGWQPDAASHAAAFAFELLGEVSLPQVGPSEDERAAPTRVAPLDIPAWEWRPDIFAPSALLRAEFGAVPFYGRERELHDLVEWSRTEQPLAVRLYTGAGGMGKTRLMLELCRHLRDDGCHAGFLSRELEAEQNATALDAVVGRDDRCLVVVDYAETRIVAVTALLRHALERTADRRTRIVLLARSRGDWWAELQRQPNRLGDVLTGPATTVESLKPLASDLAQRRAVFDRAAVSFARYVGGSDRMADAPPLEARHHERVLYILIAALAAVQGESIKDENGLLDFTLRREQQLLDKGVDTPSLGHLKGWPILQAAAVATLVGSAGDRAEAARLISVAPLLQKESDVVIDAVAMLLHRLYPGDAWLAGVLPDLLGEHLVDRVVERDPTLLSHLFGSAS